MEFRESVESVSLWSDPGLRPSRRAWGTVSRIGPGGGPYPRQTLIWEANDKTEGSHLYLTVLHSEPSTAKQRAEEPRRRNTGNRASPRRDGVVRSDGKRH
ncbi:unnamed protein product [Arctogadus glacialis]